MFKLMVVLDSALYGNDTREDEFDSETVIKYVRRFTLYLVMFIILTSSLFALSISLQCSRNKGLFFRIASGVFAFCFGIMYIFLNYYYYRVKVKGDIGDCYFCKKDPFTLKY